MKKTTLAIFAALLSIAAFAQTGDKKGWTPADRKDFISECIINAKANMSEDSARFYCYCMQEKMEIKFPAVEELAKITAEMLKSPEWLKEIKACLAPASKWGTADREGFLKECINSAKDGLGEAKAKNYCQCAMFKMEQKFPDPEDANNITEEMLNNPEFQKIIKSCLEF